MSDRYPWITAKPARRALPPWRPGRAMVACSRCGWEWKGRRRTCPACLERTDAA